MNVDHLTLETVGHGDAGRKFQTVWPLIFNAFRHPKRDGDKAVIAFTFHFELLDVETREVRCWADHPAVTTPKTSSRTNRVRLTDAGMQVEQEDDVDREEVVLPFIIPDPKIPEVLESRSLNEVPLTLSTFARGDAERHFQHALQQVWTALIDEERGQEKAKAQIKLSLLLEDLDDRGKVLKASVKSCAVKVPGLQTWTGLVRLNPVSGRGLVDLDECEAGARILPFGQTLDTDTDTDAPNVHRLR